MISEEEKLRIKEARTCKTCLEWHKHCNAECCKLIFLGKDLTILDTKKQTINIHKLVSASEKWYYNLHGVNYAHGILRFPKEHCHIIKDEVIYFRPCDYLTEDNLCLGHPENKPDLCKGLLLDPIVIPNKARVTNNCLIKYKLMEEHNDKTN